MNYYGSKELADSCRKARKNTVIIAEDIPEGRYGFRAASETRSVAETLVHIAVAHKVQYRLNAVEKHKSLAGFDFPSLIKELSVDHF